MSEAIDNLRFLGKQVIKFFNPNVRRAEQHIRETRDFLSKHCQRIGSLTEIISEGDMLAIVEPFGGFAAYRTNGYQAEQSRPIIIYDKYLEEAGMAGTFVGQLQMNPPDKIYFADRVSKTGIDDRMQFWVEGTHAYSYASILYFKLFYGHVGTDYFRVTDPGLIRRIRETFNDESLNLYSRLKDPQWRKEWGKLHSVKRDDL